MILKTLSITALLYLLLPSFVSLCQIKLWQTSRNAMLYYAFVIVPAELLGKAASYLLALPLAIYSVTKGVSVLPPPFNWFHTHDDDLDGGQHQLGWEVVTGFKLVLQRAKWMVRNPFYGGSFALFGEPLLLPVYDSTVGTWDSGSNNYSLIVDGNKRFGLRTQWFYTQSRFIRVWIGHSFQGTPVNGKYITKCHVGLFREWK